MQLCQEPAVVADLRAQHAASQFASSLYFGHCQGKRKLVFLLAAGCYTRSFQHRDVLRKIGFTDAEFPFEFGRAPIPASQQIQDVKASGIGKGFADQELAPCNSSALGEREKEMWLLGSLLFRDLN